MKVNPLSWLSDIADRLGVPVWVVYLVVIVVGFLLLSWLTAGAIGAESGDAYLEARDKAVAEKRAFLVCVTRRDCEECRRLDKVLADLDVQGYLFARVYHDVDRRRAMGIMWGSKAKSLEAMQKTTVPQLILHLPCKDDKWLKFRLVPAPN